MGRNFQWKKIFPLHCPNFKVKISQESVHFHSFFEISIFLFAVVIFGNQMKTVIHQIQHSVLCNQKKKKNT